MSSCRYVEFRCIRSKMLIYKLKTLYLKTKWIALEIWSLKQKYFARELVQTNITYTEDVIKRNANKKKTNSW